MSRRRLRASRNGTRMLVGFLAAAGLLAGSAIALPGAASADPVPGVTCTESDVPVALLGESRPSQHLHTELCVPQGGSDVVMLLVHGGSYSSEYWDFSYQPEKYSMVRAMNAAGIATANVDRLGSGRSSHPLSALVTVDQSAHTLHQVVTALRNGDLGHAFSTVVVVGHSLGSAVAEAEVARYGDVDGLIVTGFAGRLNALQLVAILPAASVAALDPRFVGKVLDPGYLTTRAGSRGVFYHTPQTDPGVIAHDDATKETFAVTEVASVAPALAPLLARLETPVCDQLPSLCDSPVGAIVLGASRQVHVPTLMVIGQQDTLVCGGLGTDCSSAQTVKAEEVSLWPADACLGVRLLPDVGHNINLHLTGQDWFDTARQWTANLVEWRNGPKTGCPAPTPGVS